MEPVLYYQPSATETERVAWYGGSSTMLHYEIITPGGWLGHNVVTLGKGIPPNIKDFEQEMISFYNDQI
jgi:hypothetical protein